jgi:4-diphosphocytidyl-2-C-methyl-D-erythritol kinase
LIDPASTSLRTVPAFPTGPRISPTGPRAHSSTRRASWRARAYVSGFGRRSRREAGSNAATTLLALERLTRIRLPDARRFAIARALGADVPLFLLGGTVLGVGRGDEVYELADAPLANLVLANPGVHVSTAEVFRRFGSLLTHRDRVAIMPFTFLAAIRIRETPTVVGNDLERAVVDEYPEVGLAREALLGSGAAKVWMTGSGATVVGIFESAGAAVSAVDALSDRGLWARAVETIDRAAYRRAFGLDV